MAAVLMFEAVLASIAPGEPIPSTWDLQSHTPGCRGRECARLSISPRELEPVQRVQRRRGPASLRGYRDLLLGKRRAYSSLPKDTYFPYLPAIEFFSREQFPLAGNSEEATEAIAARHSPSFGSKSRTFRPT